MSSQSAAVGSGAGQIPKGPAFSNVSFRDSSDWISYKKQIALYYANKTAVNVSSVDPFPVYNNNTRLTFLQGKFKQPTSGDCTSCGGPNFTSDAGIPL
jgi:hypothetical protein